MGRQNAEKDKYSYRMVWTFDGKILFKADDTPSNVFATGV